MKKIIAVFAIFFTISSFAMEQDSKNNRKSYSPGPNRDKISRHSRRLSLSDKMLIKLNLLKIDEVGASDAKVPAFVTDRRESGRSHGSPDKASPKKSKSVKQLAGSNSSNSSPRKMENNRDRYAKALTGARVAMTKIKTIDNAHYIMECQQNINNARSYYIQLMMQELPNVNQQWLELSADQDEALHYLKKELDTKVATLKNIQEYSTN